MQAIKEKYKKNLNHLLSDNNIFLNDVAILQNLIAADFSTAVPFFSWFLKLAFGKFQ